MLRWAGARLLAGQAAAAAEVAACAAGSSSCRGMASVSAAAQAKAGKQPAVAEAEVTVRKEWKAVQIPKGATEHMPTITVEPGQAFPGDLRSTSGLGMGDGLTTHTEKWLQGGQKSPMEYIAETEPIKVSGKVVASYGSDDPALGCPVEYIDLRGTSYDNPAVCKYTGNKYYSEDWRHGH